MVVVVYVSGRDAAISHAMTAYHSHSTRFFPLAWIPLLLFIILRIVGGALQINTIGNPSPEVLQVGSAVSFTIGLPLLLIAMIELLHRVNSYAGTRHINIVPLIVVDRSLQFILFVALILFGIAGGNAGKVYTNAHGGNFPTTGILNKVAIIVTLICFVVFLIFDIGTSIMFNIRRFTRERALLIGVWLATPFFIVRLVYGILAHLVGQYRANPIYGDLAFYIGLAWVMEVLAVVFLLAGGTVNLLYRRDRLRSRARGGGTETTRSTTTRSTSDSSSRGTETTESEQIVEIVEERRERRRSRRR